VVPLPPAPPATKPLSQVSKEELDCLLAQVKLFQLIFRLKGHIDSGEMLALWRSVEELIQLGCITAQAILLQKKLHKVKATGECPCLQSPFAAVPSRVPYSDIPRARSPPHIPGTSSISPFSSLPVMLYPCICVMVER